jgi:hypothetical protein
MTGRTPEADISPDELAAIRRSNRRALIGFAVVVGMFGGVPLFELVRHFLAG